MSEERARELMQQAEEKLKEYEGQLAEGQVVDMTQFEPIVTEFCQIVANMPQEQAVLFQEHMNALSQALDALANVLSARRDQVQQALGGLETQQKAAQAYAQGSVKKMDE